MDLSRALPSSVRAMIRSGKLKRHVTKSFCQGYKQANIVILPRELATDFQKFAEGNFAALPLLGVSGVGETSAGSLCADSDIRTDVPLYNVIKNGNITEKTENLTEFDWSKMVTFYIGCSFSFDKLLLDNKITQRRRKEDNDKNVSVYRTNLDCFPSGPFHCRLLVSMVPIPEDKLSEVATLTNSCSDVHGAPIHYGDPESIGIKDLSQIDFGNVTELKDGHIPVYWSCGVTGLQSLITSNVELGFTHAPGGMFLTDVQQEAIHLDKIPSEDITKVIQYNRNPDMFSAVMQSTFNKINSLSKILLKDPGKRGINNLICEEDFLKGALSLSHAKSVALVTGFPVHDSQPHDETDGLPGIISLAAVLQSLGKAVTLIVDKGTWKLNHSILECCHEVGILKDELKVKEFSNTEPLEKQLTCNETDSFYDVLFSSERVGRALDGGYYSMRGKNLTDKVSPIDDLFLEAKKHHNMLTISVGDGGNEVGMGKVLKKVQCFIPKGELIACATPSDYLVASGVSNWGCYGFGLALFTLMSCPIHERYLRKAIGFQVDSTELMQNWIPTVKRERLILEIVEKFGIKDGVAPTNKMSVDGMSFDNEHANILREMRAAVELEKETNS